jgi:hypothetical protein
MACSSAAEQKDTPDGFDAIVRSAHVKQCSHPKRGDDKGRTNLLIPDIPDDLVVSCAPRRIINEYQRVMVGLDAHGWNTHRVKLLTGLCGSISTAA